MLINLVTLDTAIIDQTNFGPDMKNWISNLTDYLNQNFMALNLAITNLIAVAGIDVGGSGVGPISVTVTGLTSSGYVNVQLISSSNLVKISSVIPGTNQFNITFSGDPGASAIIVYQAFITQPQ